MCASHLGNCNVDCLFEDFHSIALNRKRRIVAEKLLIELGLPFSGIENHPMLRYECLFTELLARLFTWGSFHVTVSILSINSGSGWLYRNYPRFC
jgi:hypothetical protein